MNEAGRGYFRVNASRTERVFSTLAAVDELLDRNAWILEVAGHVGMPLVEVQAHVAQLQKDG